MLRAGAIATVLVALPYKAFDLDRYFVPKELVLELTAGIAAVAVLIGVRRFALTRVDTLLVGFLGLSAVSAAFATNGWTAARAFAVSAGGVTLFWTARALARAGFARRLVAGLAIATVVAALTALLQAYGVRSDFFSLNRAPGGTLGNRNFVAHLAALGVPALILSVVWARRRAAALAWTVAAAVVAAALVLSRSRAAWLALAIAAAGTAPALWRTRSQWLTRALAVRAAAVGAAAALGVLAAVALPNTLNWRSRSPYLDSVVNVVDYREGSGRGRLVQYINTIRLAVSHPVLGVGPGNWPVVYPHVAPASDPSLDRDDGMTANPWPSSDWAAMLSERGVLALACLGVALLGLTVEGSRSMREPQDHAPPLAARARPALPALTLQATIIVIVVAGAFDAVLLLPAPTMLAWSLLGALDGALDPPPATRLAIPVSALERGVVIVAVAAAAGAAVVRAGARVTAMALVAGEDHPRTLDRAARMDPGSYRLQIRAAEQYARRHECDGVRPHAARAHALFPYAPEPARLLAACGVTTPRATRH